MLGVSSFTVGTTSRCVAILIGLAGLCLLVPSLASAGGGFIFEAEPIHPGCVHALAMQPGDRIPVNTAVSLEGCRSSARSKAVLQRDGEVLFIDDEVLLGEGTFGYRHLSTLDNGIHILAIRRTGPEGSLSISLAAMMIGQAPVIRGSGVGSQPVIETLGEIWLKDTRQASVRTVGNVVHYSVGVGSSKREQTLDFSRIGKAIGK